MFSNTTVHGTANSQELRARWSGQASTSMRAMWLRMRVCVQFTQAHWKRAHQNACIFLWDMCICRKDYSQLESSCCQLSQSTSYIRVQTLFPIANLQYMAIWLPTRSQCTVVYIHTHLISAMFVSKLWAMLGVINDLSTLNSGRRFVQNVRNVYLIRVHYSSTC